ncbi:MAG: hypothetical protein HYU97_09765 [Deltaproteobacteria bacterium]|nr:hypothetical protein [Deltaproteobacteria bacterium]
MRFAKKSLWVVVVLCLLGAGHLFAQEKKETLTLKNLRDYFAFDGLNPKVNACLPVEVILSNPKHGKVACQSEGPELPFTGKVGEWFKCKFSKKSDVMVFKTQAVCREEHERMLTTD